MPSQRRLQRPGFRQLLLAPLRRLATIVRRKPTHRRSNQRRHSLPLTLLPEGGGRKRSLKEWKKQRRLITDEVKGYLAEEQPIPAIKKLTQALLDDPQHPAYHELLKKAVEQRRQRRLKAGRKDPWADLPSELRKEALQLEAFSAYVDELEQLFDKVGIPPLSAPPPPSLRQAKASARASEKTSVEEAEATARRFVRKKQLQQGRQIKRRKPGSRPPGRPGPQ